MNPIMPCSIIIAIMNNNAMMKIKEIIDKVN